MKTAGRAGVALLAAGFGFVLPVARAAEAKDIFGSKCAMCHGKTGTPPGIYEKKVRAMNDAEWQKTKTDDEIRKAILEGKKGTLMASFKEAFTPEEIDGLVKYIRTLAPPSPAP